MRIKSIRLQNFLSYADSELIVHQTPDELPTIYIIDGLNLDVENDGNAGNGTGKSAFFSESIFYNIYSMGLRGNKKRFKVTDMVRYGTENMSNIVEYFIKNDNDYSDLKISRSKKIDGANTVSVVIDNDEKTKRTKRLSDKDIKSFIDLVPDVFSQIVMYYKDNITLLEMNYGQRLDFFKTIIDLSIMDDYYNAARDFRIDNDKKLFELELQIKNCNDVIEILSKDSNKYLSFVENQVNELTNKLTAAKNEALIDTDALEEEKNNISDIINKYNKQANEIQAKIVYENRCASSIKEEALKIKELSGAVCPTCKQNVPNEYVDVVIKKYLEQINVIINNVNKLNAEKTNIEQILNENSRKLSEINEKYNKAITANRIRANNIQTIQNELNKYQRELEKIKSNEDNKSTESKEYYEQQLIELQNEYNKRQEYQEDTNYWYEMLAPTSLFRSTIIKKYVNLLSDTFEYYISSLYNSEIVGKILVNDDGQIDIVLFKDGYEANYWQLSSGEKKRISIALMLSLYEFTTALNPNTPQFIVADEIFDSLDISGRTAVMETLIDVQKRHKIDLFLISHVSIPTEIIPEETPIKYVLVTKKNKISTVSYIENED